MVLYMERKLREIGGSLVITIPKQLCDLYRFKNGDMLSIEPICIGEIRIRKFPRKNSEV
jgi:antitoxin component of MazEF toxin-antitoxin module